VNSKKLIVIVGPTAVGKTEMALRLAEYFRTEIISADSRQIYKELKIGTAKPTTEELAHVHHHFINTHSITEDYDAGEYGREALSRIHQFFETQDTLIMCGGSGLYIKAVLEGFDEMPEIPSGIREKIVEEFKSKGLPWLQKEVEAADPDYFAEVDSKNPQRLMRALELYRVANIPVKQLRKKTKLEHSFEVIKIGLEVSRDELYNRIDARMDRMVEMGLFEEAEMFYPHRALNALQTVGYREIFSCLDGEYDKEEAIRLLKRNSRRYAKRQLTWFKRDTEIQWFRPGQIQEVVKLIDS
jgi:tRNA dimethylallyltransferase